MASCGGADDAISTLMDGLVSELGVTHASLLLAQPAGEGWVTVASRGYDHVGAGSEVRPNQGPIGIAAAQQRVVRINNVSSELRYARTVRQAMLRAGQAEQLRREVALPGLADAQSVMAVPVMRGGDVALVFSLESAAPNAFEPALEHGLVALGAVLLAFGVGLRLAMPRAPVAAPARSSDVLRARYFPSDDSVFVGDEYVIKSLPGRVLWKLLTEHARTGRTEFSNREIRLDATLKLPAIKDNLESRLILLRRRLEEKACGITLSPSQRGRLRLTVSAPLRLLVEGEDVAPKP